MLKNSKRETVEIGTKKICNFQLLRSKSFSQIEKVYKIRLATNQGPDALYGKKTDGVPKRKHVPIGYKTSKFFGSSSHGSLIV